MYRIRAHRTTPEHQARIHPPRPGPVFLDLLPPAARPGWWPDHRTGIALCPAAREQATPDLLPASHRGDAGWVTNRTTTVPVCGGLTGPLQAGQRVPVWRGGWR